MSLTLYNDLTRKKEPFVPLTPGRVTFYSCGPTVYDFFHIGNARPFIVFDVLRRYLEHLGYEVTFVQNFTDIDDKMIQRAHSEGIEVSDLAARFIGEYYKDADALGIRRADVAPLATEHMPEIIGTIERIIERGHAYVSEGDVYFDVRSWPGYGRLCKQGLDELEVGARVEVGERKRDPLDFALWKAQKPGEPAWDSPWGKGRPGWHIECSAMSSKYLGTTIDIHSGGVDLTFPHHENEIAQSEAASGEPFVRFWLHNGFLLIDKEKMSKSLGNFMTARAARQKYPPLAIRLFMLGAHYRSPINFAPEGLEQAERGVTRLRNCRADLAFARRTRMGGEPGAGSFPADFLAELKRLDDDFHAAMDDDFNTAAAVGVLFEVVKAINSGLKEHPSLPAAFFDAAEAELAKIDGILGVIGPEELPKEEESAGEEALGDAEVERLIEERCAARKAKDFARSDEIRAMLAERGVVLEDTPQGTRWKREI
ncbi:cysteine--tRNA ligase [uncultured Fretibacterium sp.]|uniref:cysteine--tRNA ligase n=1 Tax=uncultured Fretibacterium sp. TaxID=1678694 RepID=UPI00325FB1BC